MTNYSGKFLIKEPVNGYSQSINNEDASGQNYVPPVDPGTVDIPQVPPCPTCSRSSMNEVKRLFGEYWWMWLAALIIIMSSKE